MMLRPLLDLPAALDGGGHTEGVSDRFAECLRAIDDEQPGGGVGSSPLDRGDCSDQGLDDDRCSPSPASTTARDMLCRRCHRRRSPPSGPWSPTCRPSIWMTSRSSSERSEASQAFIFLRDSATKRRDNGRLRGAVATRFRQVALGQTDRKRWYLRVDTFSTIRLSAHSSSRLPSRSACQLSKLTSLPARSRTRGRGQPSLCRRGKPISLCVLPHCDNLDGPHGGDVGPRTRT